MRNKAILSITQAAVLTAILVAWQAATAPIGQTLLTGSGVNFILIIAASLCSMYVGVAVAVISPFMAALAGVGPAFPILAPFIALGNIAIVLVWHVFRKYKPLAVVAGAAVKFAVLYVSVVKIAIPLFIPPKPAPTISAAFSFPQLITALIGGLCAFAFIPAFRKVTGYSQTQSRK